MAQVDPDQLAALQRLPAASGPVEAPRPTPLDATEERPGAGSHLLAATVALLVPVNLRQAIVYPTAGHVLLAAANVAVLIVLLLLRGWLPGRPLGTRATGT